MPLSARRGSGNIQACAFMIVGHPLSNIPPPRDVRLRGILLAAGARHADNAAGSDRRATS